MNKVLRFLSFVVLISVILGPTHVVNPPEAIASTILPSQPSVNYYTWSDWLARYAARINASQPASTTTSSSNPASTPVQNPTTSSTLQPRVSDEDWMLREINRERTTRGISPLTIDPTLVELARKKSQDIVINNYFAHQSPTYGSPSNMVKEAGIKYWLCGENLARATTVTVAHELLMDSSAHRSNILNRNYTHIGIGVVPQKSGSGVVVTQLFIAK